MLSVEAMRRISHRAMSRVVILFLSKTCRRSRPKAGGGERQKAANSGGCERVPRHTLIRLDLPTQGPEGLGELD